MGQHMQHSRVYSLFMHESPLTERFARTYPDDNIPPRHSGTPWRSYVYRRHLYAMPLTDITERRRIITAEFYRWALHSFNFNVMGIILNLFICMFDFFFLQGESGSSATAHAMAESWAVECGTRLAASNWISSTHHRWPDSKLRYDITIISTAHPSIRVPAYRPFHPWAHQFCTVAIRYDWLRSQCHVLTDVRWWMANCCIIQVRLKII